MELVKVPKLITKLIKSSSKDERKRGIDSFLMRTNWNINGTPEDLKRFACRQLHLRIDHVAEEFQILNPKYIWASQDGLEKEKMEMVKAAYDYYQERDLEFPPIIVWHFYGENRMRYICHDGHHRTYFLHKKRKRIKAVVLEPLGNYEIVENKFRYAFQIQKKVIKLPIHSIEL